MGVKHLKEKDGVAAVGGCGGPVHQVAFDGEGGKGLIVGGAGLD